VTKDLPSICMLSLNETTSLRDDLGGVRLYTSASLTERLTEAGLTVLQTRYLLTSSFADHLRSLGVSPR